MAKRQQIHHQLVLSWRAVLAAGLVMAIVLGGGVMLGRASAETYPGGSDNGKTSRIKELDTTLAGLGYGSATATPDWGNLWNRIKTSATWTPDGDATANDVAKGKTFFGADRTKQTGARSLAGPCPTQGWHDSYGLANQTDNCTIQNTWTVPSDGIAGSDKQDPVTGLVWSQALRLDAGNIEFSPTGAASFSWDNSHTNNQGRTAIQLCTDRGNGWRLPTQKELCKLISTDHSITLASRRPATGRPRSTVARLLGT